MSAPDTTETSFLVPLTLDEIPTPISSVSHVGIAATPLHTPVVPALAHPGSSAPHYKRD